MSDPNAPAESRRRRILWLLAVLGLLLLLFWLLYRHQNTSGAGHKAPSAHKATATSVKRDTAPDRADTRSRVVPDAFRDEPPGKPIIDKVIVEKSEVCEGEENLITVLAHTPGHKDDGYLHYRIGGSLGSSVVLRSYKRDKDDVDPTPRTITVFGRKNVQTSVKVPYFKIKDCTVPRILIINRRLVPNREDHFEFWVRIINRAAKTPFKPVKYRWSFGDGKSTKTTEPMVVHSYQGRSQTTLHSNFVVRCEAVDAKGNTVVGRSGFALMNVAFEELRFKGIVTLFAQGDPRYPELDDDGVVEQTFTIWHHYPGSVTISKLIRTQHTLYRQGTSPEPDDVSPASVLGTDVIPPEGIETTVRLDTKADKHLFSIEYIMLGRTPEGYRVHGRFSIMRPPANPTRDHHRPVVNPELKAKILAARKILGKEFVTQEEINRLDRLGYFKNLQVDYDNPAYPWQMPPAPMKEVPPRKVGGQPAPGDTPPPPR